jgi:hypothetical protein
MLRLKPNCQACGCALPPASGEAMICSFECTFCRVCVDGRLQNVCPNCGGGFTLRPVRPKALLETNPPSGDRVAPGFDAEKHAALVTRYARVAAHER